ncbi:Nn.00g079120.m01.CDS01 [Neocucurbitaria sp. VM-36]
MTPIKDFSLGLDGNQSPTISSLHVPSPQVDTQYFLDCLPSIFLQSAAMIPQDKVYSIESCFHLGKPTKDGKVAREKEREELLKRIANAMERINKAQKANLIQKLFEAHAFGLWDHIPSDAEQHLLKLQQVTYSMISGKSDGDFKIVYKKVAINKRQELVDLAALILQRKEQDDSLLQLLNEKNFTDRLHRHILSLEQIKHLHNDLVSMAREAKIACNVSTLRVTTTSPQQPSFPYQTRAIDTRIWASPSEANPLSKKRQAFIAAVKPQPNLVSAAAKFFDKARGYLEDQDRQLEYRSLQPDAKRVTYLFAAAVLHKQYPDPKWASYYAFGFATCWTENQKQLLLGLYHSLLTDASNKVVFFKKLWFALAKNELNSLLSECGYTDFQEVLPGLDRFLSRRPKERETVWRLIQFLHDKANDEPHPYVKRDYGFQVCQQRADVLMIKDVYARLLEKCRPSELHQAAMNGALYDLCDEKGVFVAPQHKRFMRNDFDVLSVDDLGYENGIGLKRHEAPLFRFKLRP